MSAYKRQISEEGQQALDAVVAAMQDVHQAELELEIAWAKRDAALREAWRQRVSQSMLAEALGLSLTRAGALSRRARERG
jgi:hypothetical protein